MKRLEEIDLWHNGPKTTEKREGKQYYSTQIIRNNNTNKQERYKKQAEKVLNIRLTITTMVSRLGVSFKNGIV